jgi:zona occludens toxin (predicted ATPase)
MAAIQRRQIQHKSHGAIPHATGGRGLLTGREGLAQSVGTQRQPDRTLDAVHRLVKLEVVNEDVKKVCRHPTRYDFADWAQTHPTLLIENLTGNEYPLKRLIDRPESRSLANADMESCIK